MISREKTSNLIKLAILVLINLCIICFAFYQVPSSALASTQPSDQPQRRRHLAVRLPERRGSPRSRPA